MSLYTNSCIAIGNFDGIHIGHDTLIREMIEISKFSDLNSMILTFNFTDTSVKKNSANTNYIMSFDKKMELLRKYNVCNVCCIDLDEVVSKYTPLEFIEKILVEKYDVKHVVVGYNFRFGRYAFGNTDTLKIHSKEFGYKVSILNKIKDNDGDDVSSSIIRNYIKKGNFDKVNNLLTNNYTIYYEDLIKICNNKFTVNENCNLTFPIDGEYEVLINNYKTNVLIENKNNRIFLNFPKDIKMTENIVFLNN